MFENKIVLLSLGDSFSTAEIKNGRAVDALDITFDDKVIIRGKISDKAQCAYIISKLLARYDSNSKIIIRNSNGVLFRNLTLKNLNSDEIESYIRFNISEIFPFDVKDRFIKYEYLGDKLYIFGIYKEDFEFIEKCLSQFNFKQKFFTVFPSELNTFFNSNNISNAIAVNVLYNSYEIVFNKNNEIIHYDKIEKSLNSEIIKFIKTKCQIMFGEEDYKILVLNEFNAEDEIFNILSENLEERTVQNIKFNYENYLRWNMKPVNFFEENNKKEIKTKRKTPILKIIIVIFVFIFLCVDYLKTSRSIKAEEQKEKPEISESEIYDIKEKLEKLEVENEKLLHYKKLYEEKETNEENLKRLIEFISVSEISFNDENVLKSIDYQDGMINIEAVSKNEKIIKENLDILNANLNGEYLLSNMEYTGEYYNYSLKRAEENHE